MRALHALRIGLTYAAWPFFFILRFLLIFLAVLFVPFVIVYFATATRKDAAYRNLHPYAVKMCADGLASGWDVLSHINQEQAKAGGDDEDGWIDPSNNEHDAIREDPEFRRKFRCSLQRHIVPVIGPAIPAVQKQLEYYLGFVEFRESGEPYSLVQEGPDGDEQVPPDLLRKLKQRKAPYTVTQLDALRQHLATDTGTDYVLVFIHGWRHDASIGDQNVADVRHYAAHAARFLAERCQFEKDHNLEPVHCDTRVTAIYIGWRGARVNERAMRETLGMFGSFIGQVASWPTLFDRKPVSEQVAPAALSALRAIEREISTTDTSGNPKPNSPHNRMIVFGHSLGGNLLATSLQDDLIKAVRLHKPGEAMPPVLGDLVVLVNPAAEAEKWTILQREVWSRIAFRADANTHLTELAQGHNYFPAEQRPVVVSVTSSFGFPPGGLRDGDCMRLALADDSALAEKIAEHKGEFEQAGVYDWATHDLFPTFKMDFRPIAERIGRLTDWVEGKPPRGTACVGAIVPWYRRLLALPLRATSTLFSTFPFQNTDRERSHTIGHLDPPRPGTGSLTDHLTSAAPFGTTHELFRVPEEPEKPEEPEQHNAYGALPNASLKCDPANHWLRLARLQTANGTSWDSKQLGNNLDAGVGEGHPSAQFVHGFPLGGTAPITRANDPFWNMRVSNSLMSKHDGYRLSSFICAMNELVMDDITGVKTEISDKTSAVNTSPAAVVPAAAEQ
jgi:hypothetical protein